LPTRRSSDLGELDLRGEAGCEGTFAQREEITEQHPCTEDWRESTPARAGRAAKGHARRAAATHGRVGGPDGQTGRAAERRPHRGCQESIHRLGFELE